MPKKTATPAKGSAPKKVTAASSPLFEKRPKNFGIGGAIRPRRDLTRFVRWPKYIQLQRQRRVLLRRLKVPPTINQFNKALDKSAASQLFKLLAKYKPESKVAKKDRLLKAAAAKEKGATVEPGKRPVTVKYGLNHVTSLVEQKKAKLVILAHDVDPLELVLWMPTLCRKMDVPYCVVKGKSRLGALVHQKTAAALAITEVNKEDMNSLKDISQLAHESYNKNTDLRRQWGGGQLGPKSQAAVRKKEKAIKKEESARMKM